MYPVRRQISPHAATLRRNQTAAEQRVCATIRNRQLDGFKFRRQATVEPYVVDFLCIEATLAVELDGGQHDAATDANRTRFLEGRGLEVLRFWNNDVLANTEGVLQAIAAALNHRTEQKRTLTQPSPANAGEG